MVLLRTSILESKDGFYKLWVPAKFKMFNKPSSLIVDSECLK